jgi:nitrite reductase/ring-hydroxylating ferredoxin subunit
MTHPEALPLFPDEPLEPPYVTVAQVGEIPEGQGRAFPVGKRMVAVFLKDARYFAIDDFCPHQGASLAEGYVEGCAVACPWHHWRFSIVDGSWLDNPKIAVETYRVRVIGQNIQVQVPDEEVQVPDEETGS